MIPTTSTPHKDYDDEPHFYRPAYKQSSLSLFENQKSKCLQKLRATEEAKRHVEAERYRRMQEARQNYILRLQEEEAYHQAHEAAERRIEIEEETKQNVEEEEFWLYDHHNGSGRYFESKEAEQDVRDQTFDVIEGPDGHLYRVETGDKSRPRRKPRRRRSIASSSSRGPQSAEDTHHLIRGPDGILDRIKL